MKIMNQDIKKLKQERQQIAQQLQALENQKGQLITRMLEIQGIIRYIQEKEQEKNKKKYGNTNTQS